MIDRDEDAAAGDRPTGREAVRAAILDAASRRFAERGSAASLRDIAADAGVNLGLIHRHFGNKEDLLRAVLARHAGAGAAAVEDVPDLTAAVRKIFGQTGPGAQYLRIVAWLLVDGGSVAQYQDRFPTIDALRRRASSEDQELRLLLAFAASYGWSVFGEQLLAAFGRPPSALDDVQEHLRELVAQLVDDPPPGRPPK